MEFSLGISFGYWCSIKIKRARMTTDMLPRTDSLATLVNVSGEGQCIFPWRTTLLPFPVHQRQMPTGNSRYRVFGHLVTAVSCQIWQITDHLTTHGWQIMGIGYGWKCCMCTAAGDWQGVRSEEVHNEYRTRVFLLMSKCPPGLAPC